MDNNKAYGERTLEEKAKMEKEAKEEIERNFPSYFDEFQRTIFMGYREDKEEIRKDKKQEVKIHSIIKELLHLEDS